MKLERKYKENIQEAARKTNEAFYVSLIVFSIISICVIILLILSNLTYKQDDSQIGLDKHVLEEESEEVLGLVTTSVEVSVCGNDVVEHDESCDGDDLAGESCSSLGFQIGTLECNANCTFNTSACSTEAPYCGNNIKEVGEDCDGSDIGSASCQLYGFDTGSIDCYENCTIDISDCSNFVSEEDEELEEDEEKQQDEDDDQSDLQDENDLNNNNIPDQWEENYSCLIAGYKDADDDPDNDGLKNLDEYKNGCNPCNEDSDDDGMPDGWEVEHGLDPKKHDANEDPDSDGYNNIAEFYNNTNPKVSDKPSDLPETGQDEKRSQFDFRMIAIGAVLIFSLGFGLFVILKNRNEGID